MPPPIPVILVAYRPEWPEMAAGYAVKIMTLGPAVAVVHHIGSTAVPGLAAKPIIDLMPLVTDLAALDRYRADVEALGYDWHGEFGLPGRRYCTLTDATGTRVAQFHFFELGSAEAERHLAFRDYLRAHPDEARAYAAEKRRARDLHPADSHAYTDEKGAWIRDREAKALAWVASYSSATNASI